VTQDAQTERVALSGAPGSPYTRKMLGVLRYRRIPYRFLPLQGPLFEAMPKAKVPLLPTFYLPDESGVLQAVTDSTPLIRRLEREHAGRSVIPPDPALRFIDELIEDYGDEWLTKAMFHYRWAYEADAAKAAAILPVYRGVSAAREALDAAGRAFAERQIGRLGYVGSNSITAPLIEASYERFLAAFDAHLTTQPFVLGHRPAASDFAIFGQLTQLAGFDPTPMAVTLRLAPRVVAWTDQMEDQSGLEPTDADWMSPDAASPTLRALLAEVGRVYAPVMIANARAVAEKSERVEAQVDGGRWTQAPFPYQAKTLGWLRQSYASLGDRARGAVDRLLAGTGCEGLFS
jgi:glutathione S-transferase